MPSGTNQYRNEILRNLDPEDLAVLAPHLEPATLGIMAQLERPHTPIEHVFFLEDGLASIVGRMSGGRDIEVGITGREGFTGAAVVLGGTQSPNTTFVQIPSTGYRIEAKRLQDMLSHRVSLRSALTAFVQALIAQMSSTVIANGHAKLEERLARWLLMVHDRIDNNVISLTHEFLALMLGVRRPGITVALHILEGKGHIRASRGQITILNRKGLMDQANGSYGAAEAEYHRLMGTPVSRHG